MNRGPSSIRRVVLVAPSGLGGIQVWCAEYARELRKRESIEATILYEDYGNRRGDGGMDPGGKEIATEVFSYGPLDNRSRVCGRLEKRFLQEADAVYPNTSGMAYQALAHLGGRRPVAIAGCHGDFEHDYEAIARFSPWMDGIFAVSEMCAERLRLRLPAGAPPVTTISHGISPVVPAPLPTGALRLLFTGRLDPVKRLDDFLKVAEALKERRVNFQLELVGDGPERERLEESTRERGLEDRVLFTGRLPQERIGGRIDECHVLLLLSERESFGRSVLEAMSRGRTAIVTSTCGCREAIRDGENGFLVLPGEIDRIAGILEGLDGDREALARLGEAAAQTVDRFYRPEEIHNRHITLLESAVKRHKERRTTCAPAPYGFSRLDAGWIPDWISRAARRTRMAAAKKAGNRKGNAPQENGQPE